MRRLKKINNPLENVARLNEEPVLLTKKKETFFPIISTKKEGALYKFYISETISLIEFNGLPVND